MRRCLTNPQSLDLSDAFLLVGFHLPEFQTCQDPPHGSEKQAKKTKGRMRRRGVGGQMSRCLTFGKLLKERKKVKSLSRVRLFATPWTVTYQASLSMGFSRQEYWSGLPFPSPGDLPDPGIEPRSPALEADALTSEPAEW